MMKHVGNLTITKENRDLAKTLMEVGGHLDVRAECEFPVLATVGSLDVRAECEFPVLATVGSLYVSAECEFPVLATVGGEKVRPADECRRNLRVVAELALKSADALEMKAWHTCETTHCIAGWAAHALPGGKELEARTNAATAGAILLGPAAACKFQVDNNTARKWLQSKLEEAAV